MYGYVYIVTNKLSGKIYIGKKTGKFDPKYLGSGRYIKNAIRKYGSSNFQVSVIEYANDLSDLNNKEIYWINYYRTNNFDMYNISSGGDGGNTYLNLNEEDRLARLEKLRNNGYFSTLSKEQYDEMIKKAIITKRKRAKERGYWYTDQARKNMSEGQKHKRPFTEDEKFDIIKRRTETRKRNGYRHSKETIEKIRKSNSGKTRSDAFKQRLSTVRKGKFCKENNPFYGKHHSETTKMLLRKYNELGICGSKGRKWMNNGMVNIRVKPEDINLYVNIGYMFGRLPFRKV